MSRLTLLTRQLEEYHKRRERYYSITRNCTKHIKSLEQKMMHEKSREERIKQTKVYIKQVEEFLGRRFKHWYPKNKLNCIEIGILCKYCTDKGADTRYLAEYLGLRRIKTIYDKRKWFGSNIGNNLDLWNRFKQFINETTA